MDALTFVGYASFSIEGVKVWPKALIGRIIAGDEGFQADAWFELSLASAGEATILGWPAFDEIDGSEPEKA